MHPKIGIIICGFNENRQFVPNVYIQSVRYAKGIPLLIPLVRSDRMIDDYVSLCDGFLLCGGEDITPLLFGEEPQNGNGKTDITVDLFQIRLMKRVLASRKPVLAICRGMQILNVSCGGTIWQDLSLIPQPTLNHTQQSASRGDVSHRIKIERCSKLKQFVGSCIYVNSFHHQSVKTPGRNVCVIFFYCLPFKKTAFERKKTPFEEPAICRMVLFERGFTVVISYLFPNIFSYSGVPSSVAK